jgi:hypothetical protein
MDFNQKSSIFHNWYNERQKYKYNRSPAVKNMGVNL